MGVISLPYIQSFYLSLGALYLFIPIMGRAGAGINSEIVIANMISFLFCYLLSFTVRSTQFSFQYSANVTCLPFSAADSPRGKKRWSSDKYNDGNIPDSSQYTDSNAARFPVQRRSAFAGTSAIHDRCKYFFLQHQYSIEIDSFLFPQHTHRQYYNENGTVRHSGTGYWLVDLDMNSPRNVETIVPEVAAASPTARDCEEELYCGLPYLMPVTTFLW